MIFFAIDTEGWAEAYESAASIENSLEFIDVSSNEYTVIDSEGYLYSWQESQSRRCGFELTRTLNQNPALLERLQRLKTNDSFKI